MVKKNFIKKCFSKKSSQKNSHNSPKKYCSKTTFTVITDTIKTLREIDRSRMQWYKKRQCTLTKTSEKFRL